jgi:ribonuclease BN (tRNA processing enzyme)/tetratricopeptide (TPR) repeat protein
MNDDGNDRDRLINDAIDESIKFEELMDKTDFDSWLDVDSHETLKNMGQLVDPFIIYKDNEKKLKEICKRKRKGPNKIPNATKSQVEKYISYQLFLSKNKRLDARISSEKDEEENKYEEALYYLLSVLNHLHNSKIDEKWLKKWMILLYNDLSICYAGLKKSSLSRGYAEEAKKIIEKEGSYKKFDERLNADNSTNGADIEDHNFVSSKLYDLYTVTLFNQAVAEKRSSLYTEAERNFKKIIKYAERKTNKKVTPLRNFNYHSAIVNLSDLYMDQGRGKEALELLRRVIDDSNQDDIRYWNASLYEITALIDQSEYDKAEKLLRKKFIKEEKGFTLNERHKVTSLGFKGINNFARCKIEKVRNTLEMDDKKKEEELKKPKNLIINNSKIIKDRKQRGLETKAYKHLSDIYELRKDKNGNVIKYLIKFISEAEPGIDNLDTFVSHHQQMDNWIDKCDDLNALESFTDQIIEIITDESIDKYRDLLEKLKDKIKKECDDKGQLSRAERIVTKINEVVGEEKRIKYPKDTFDKIFRNDEKGFTLEDIRTRLDINEKEFDSVLFTRSNIKNDNHIVEMIVLRRWNSFSPGLFRESTGSLGGGYLLRINKDLMEGNDGVEKEENESVENIVIDPGYNFLQNFRSEGFCIEDIDTIIVTHSHLDHCAELLPIMDLIFQINKRYKDYKKKERKKKRVSLCLSKGAYKKFSGYADDPDWQKQLKDVIILENLDKKTWMPFKGLRISAIPTPHMDLGGVNAIGLIIEIDGTVDKNEEISETVRLGFTSDTPWYTEIKDNFDVCDLLCVHLGSIKYQEIGYTDDRHNLKSEKREIDEEKKEDKFKETYTKSNHLLFFGTEDIISHYDKTKKDSLIIVGEFGEELKYGLRADLCTKLSMGKKFIHCLPGDIGQYIVIEKDGTKKVRCNFCESFVRPNEIKTFSYGREDAIQYICQTCEKSLSVIQKHAIIKHRLTRH